MAPKPPQTYTVQKGKLVAAAEKSKKNVAEAKQEQRFQAWLKQSRITGEQLNARRKRLDDWSKKLSKAGASVELAEFKELAENIDTVQEWAKEFLSMSKELGQGAGNTAALIGSAKGLAARPSPKPSALDLTAISAGVVFCGLLAAFIKSVLAAKGPPAR